MRYRDLRKADFTRQLAQTAFMIGVAVTMHQGNGHGANTSVENVLQLGPRGGLIQSNNHIALGIQALGHFHNRFIQQFRQDDFTVEQARPILVGNAQGIAKPFGHE